VAVDGFTGAYYSSFAMTSPNIIRALNDPSIFGRYFKAESWGAWRVFLAALFGLPLGYDQLRLFQQFTGRSTAPKAPLQEAWLVVGRRVACFKDWKPYLGPGEVGTIMIVAKDRAQARSIKRFISGLLRVLHGISTLPTATTSASSSSHGSGTIRTAKTPPARS
jgi:hypothetical protein